MLSSQIGAEAAYRGPLTITGTGGGQTETTAVTLRVEKELKAERREKGLQV